MKWLHLSDLHFNKDADSEALRNSLLIYLENKIDKVDYLFITGDYRDANADPNELVSATEIVEYIRKIAEKIKIDNKDIVLVPGNHEVNMKFPNRTKAINNNKKYNPNQGNIQQLGVLVNAFEFYKELHETLFGDDDMFDKLKENPHYLHAYEKIQVLALNTELFFGKKNILGTRYIQSALQRERKVTIALGHTPVGVLDYDEEVKVREYFQSYGVILYLCGHKHTMRFDNINGIYYIEAGCLKYHTGADRGFTTGELNKNNIVIQAHIWGNGNWAEYCNFNMGNSKLIIPLDEKAFGDTGNSRDEQIAQTEDEIYALKNQYSDFTYPNKTLIFSIGSWHDSNKADRAFVSGKLDDDYDNLKRDILNTDIFEYVGEIIKPKNHMLALCAITSNLTASDADMILDLANELLLNKYTYSQNIRVSVAKTIAYMSNNAELTADRAAFEELGEKCLSRLFNANDFYLWSDISSILAESSPKIYLDKIEESLNNMECSAEKTYFYFSSIIHTLQKLAWSSKYIIKSTCILGIMANVSPDTGRIVSEIATIFMPWVQNNGASIDKEKQALSALYKEQPDIAWHVLVSLLPSHSSSVMRINKPDYITIDELSDNITNDEWENRVANIYELLFDFVKESPKRAKDIAIIVEDLFGQHFDDAINLITVAIENDLFDNEIKTQVFHTLDNIVSKHEYFIDADWRLPQKQIECIKKLRDTLTPTDIIEANIRLFGWDNNFGEFKSNGSNEKFRENQEKLLQKRSEIVGEINAKEGFNGLCRLLSSDTTSTTPSNGSLDITNIAKATVKANIDIAAQYLKNIIAKEGSLGVFARSYVWEQWKCENKNWKWVDDFNFENYSNKEIAVFFLSLPFTCETWNRIVTNYPETEKSYWNEINQFSGAVMQACPDKANEKESEYAVEKMLVAGAFNPLFCYLYRSNGKCLDASKKVDLLLEFIEVFDEEDRIYLDVILLTEELGKDINPENQEKLLKVEWILLLHLMNNGIKPIAIMRKIDSCGKYYKELIEKSYNEEGADSIEIKKAKKAIDYCLPSLGYDLHAKCFNQVKFDVWLTNVIDESTCTEMKTHCEYQIGRAIYYFPHNNEGFWIPERLAQFLEDSKEARDGFRDAENGKLLGETHWKSSTIDSENSDMQKFEKLKKLTEKRGYRKLSELLDSIADSHKRGKKSFEKFERKV